MNIKETKDGLLLPIFVKPNQPVFRIEIDGDEVVVYATEEPERGKVNKEIIKEFSRLLGAKVELAGGFTAKHKQLLITGVEKQPLEKALSGFST